MYATRANTIPGGNEYALGAVHSHVKVPTGLDHGEQTTCPMLIVARKGITIDGLEDPIRQFAELRPGVDLLTRADLSEHRCLRLRVDKVGQTVSESLLGHLPSEAIVLKAEVPGMKRDSLEVEAVGNRLSVAGVREIPTPEGEFRYHRRERQAGEFRRVFRLPYEVDREKATASYRDGVLTVRLEKAEAAKPRQIQITG